MKSNEKSAILDWYIFQIMLRTQNILSKLEMLSLHSVVEHDLFRSDKTYVKCVCDDLRTILLYII